MAQFARRLVLEFLQDNDAPCPACGYNCRALAAPACPECAAPLRLALDSEQAKLGAWLLGVLAFAMGAGFDGVAAILLGISVYRFPPPGGMTNRAAAIISIFVILSVLQFVAILTLHRRRHRFLARPRRSQWRLALAMLAGVFVAHSLYGLLLSNFL
ncbi:MAG: hypothetical protein WC718_02510 [Phycisphaerales bacterium]|jgi:hypothetical protein